MSSGKFGNLPDGREADLITLTKGNIEVNLTNYGCIIQSIKVPDKNSDITDIVLGFDSVEQYVNYGSHIGCIVGRYANRISDARFTLDGILYKLAANDGKNSLHGGLKGLDKVLWTVKKANGDRVTFSYISPDGDEGYPGNLNLIVDYSLTMAGELLITYEAQTDKATIINLTNHSYFNLAGKGDILDHEVKINADFYTPTNKDLIPTREIQQVAGTPMDLRKSKTLRPCINSDYKQIKLAGGYDVNYIINGWNGKLNFCASVYDPATSRRLNVYTTQPGVQFYTGNFLNGRHLGKEGWIYNRHAGLCLETQHYPDSPNKPDFPSTVLRPGQIYRESTLFQFKVE